MAKINLLPWRSNRLKFLNRRFILLVGLVVSSCVFLCILLRFHFVLKVAEIASNISFLHTELDKSSSQVKEVSDLLLQKSQVLQRIELLEKLDVQRNIVTSIINNIANSLPNNIVLHEISAHDDMLKLTGEAEQHVAIANYVSELSNKDWILTANLVEQSLLKFMIDVKIKGVLCK